MDDIKAGLQYAFQTRNRLTLALSTSGHGGMEACLDNLLESDETVLIAKCGIWGQCAADMANRIGANVSIQDRENRRKRKRGSDKKIFYNSLLSENDAFQVTFLSTAYGVPFDLVALKEALEIHRPSVMFVTHAESSTGMKQPLEGVGKLVHR